MPTDADTIVFQRESSDSRAEGNPSEGAPQQGVPAEGSPSEELAALREEVQAWRSAVEAQDRALGEMSALLSRLCDVVAAAGTPAGRAAPNEIPPERKYTYAEAGVRITTGRDPKDVPREEWKKCLSVRTVQRLTAREDGPLRRFRVGRSAFITEAAIRRYERGVREGWVEGFEVKHPREYRK